MGTLPTSFKISSVIPIYKNKGNKDDPSNFRPIALTSFLAKLLERCVKYYLQTHLETHHFFSNNQFGFRCARSTNLALCNMMDTIRSKCVGGNAVLGIYLDVAKAFDCISHSKLLKMLEIIRLDSQMINWFHSYLIGRTFCVNVADHASKENNVSIGVPQGSVLGPYLFIIYLNFLIIHIQTNFPEISISVYADDTTILIPIDKNCLKISIHRANEVCTFIKHLYDAFKLSINVSKTKCILFKQNRTSIFIDDGDIKMDGVRLELSDNTVCLGLTMASNASWSDHYDEISGKCYGVISTLSRLKCIGFKEAYLVSMYKALFEPLFMYGVEVWGYETQTVLNKFQVLQNQALRAISGIPRDSSVEKFRVKHELLNVHQMCLYKSACLCFKIFNGNTTVDFIRPTIRHNDVYNLRSNNRNLLVNPVPHTAFSERAPSYQFQKIWNDLPLEIRDIEKYESFKKALFRYCMHIN